MKQVFRLLLAIITSFSCFGFVLKKLVGTRKKLWERDCEVNGEEGQVEVDKRRLWERERELTFCNKGLFTK